MFVSVCCPIPILTQPNPHYYFAHRANSRDSLNFEFSLIFAITQTIIAPLAAPLQKKKMKKKKNIAIIFSHICGQH